MAQTVHQLTDADGDLTVHTEVTGRAARMGHRLTIAMTRWSAAVTVDGEAPRAVELTVDVDSLQVLRGEGGLKALSGPEKALARSNALSCFDVGKFGRIRFAADDVAATDRGYRLTGTLEIHGRQRPQVVDVTVDGQRVTATVPVRQSDFGMKPYSMFVGSMKVVDEVSVAFDARLPTST